MITDEEKILAQNVGLDLTNSSKDIEITSGYIHFEKNNSKYEEYSKFENYTGYNHIETKFSKFIEKI